MSGSADLHLTQFDYSNDRHAAAAQRPLTAPRFPIRVERDWTDLLFSFIALLAVPSTVRQTAPDRAQNADTKRNLLQEKTNRPTAPIVPSPHRRFQLKETFKPFLPRNRYRPKWII